MRNLDYGIIGNCQSAALISKTGSIDWCCLPKFDSPSVFAKLLDETKGGTFEINVDSSYQLSQKYIYKTNILVTEFNNGTDAFEVIDFMPRYIKDNDIQQSPAEIVRYIKLLSGNPKFKVNFKPKLGYAKELVKTRDKGEYIKSSTTTGEYDSVYLYSSFSHEAILEKKEIHLQKNEFFLFSYYEKLMLQDVERQYLKMQRTRVYWLDWAEKTTTYKLYNDEILRSALTLKMLTYERTGAVLAAATTSLPETIGEVRNWDYRFCWIRDASMVVKVVSGLGHKKIVEKYLEFIVKIVPKKNEKMQIMYGIDGQKKLTEEFLEHLDGYMGSKPVRIGNAAYHQKQNDIYGILMDVLYQQYLQFNNSLFYREELWTIVKATMVIVKENWKKADKGIWEFRTEERHFTFSKLLCWVAIDRGVKIAELLNLKEKVSKWQTLRDEIAEDIHLNAWNEEKQAYTQSYGSPHLDASTLLMESYGFIDAMDPRYVSTVLATEKELCKDGLMYRYINNDDFGLPSSSFTICSFWFINSLFKIGKKKEAKRLFDQILSYSNHLGLFSEDIDFETKRLLGNFPQAYSHLALIETAINFSELSDEYQE
jgi:alpha,alpha-trehalase